MRAIFTPPLPNHPPDPPIYLVAPLSSGRLGQRWGTNRERVARIWGVGDRRPAGLKCDLGTAGDRRAVGLT